MEVVAPKAAATVAVAVAAQVAAVRAAARAEVATAVEAMETVPEVKVARAAGAWQAGARASHGARRPPCPPRRSTGSSPPCRWRSPQRGTGPDSPRSMHFSSGSSMSRPIIVQDDEILGTWQEHVLRQVGAEVPPLWNQRARRAGRGRDGGGDEERGEGSGGSGGWVRTWPCATPLTQSAFCTNSQK